MRSQTIVDTRLSVALDLDTSLKANSFFFMDPLARAHLANQLLIYDQLAIPTKDFAAAAIFIHWLGLKEMERLLRSGSLAFLHRPSLLGYAGNGNGISGFIIQPSKESGFAWWQTAMFGHAEQAIEIQLRYWCPSIGVKQRSSLTQLIASHSHGVEYDNDFFMKNIAHESYTDIMQSAELSAWASLLSGNPRKLDLKRVPGVAPNQLKVLSSGGITEPAELVLHVAETNMALVMGRLYHNSDVWVPAGGELLLRSKLQRAKVAPAALENFISLLDLEGVPDPGAAVASGEKSFADILRIRGKRLSRRFRKWLRTADSGSARELERLYVSSLGRKSFYDKLPAQSLRFALTRAADAVLPGAGAGVELVDSFFVRGWVEGYSPKLFLDQLRKLRRSES